MTEETHELVVQKVAPGIIIHLFKNQKETMTMSKLFKRTGYCIGAVYKNIKILKEMKIIEHIAVETISKTNKPFKLTQKGEKIAMYLMNIK